MHATYKVVLRCAETLLRIRSGEGIHVTPITTEYGVFELKIVTRTDKVKHIETPIPRELWIEVTGPAPSLDTAINIAALNANHYARQIAFGTNAWHGLLLVHLAYECTPGVRERIFFQNWVRDEIGLPRVARDIDCGLMVRLFAAIVQLTPQDRARVFRSIVQYTDALQHWKKGNELYALAHMYMGVEAITPVAIRSEVQRRGLANRKELERALSGPPPDSLWLRVVGHFYRLAGGYIPSGLDAWARRELIFCGDKETFSTAKRASDHLEHGLSPHHDVAYLAVQCLEKTAQYLRQAILNYLPLSNEDRKALQDSRYGKPMNVGGFDRQLHATIVCDEDEVAAPDQAYPFVKWGFSLKEFSVEQRGGHRMRVTQTIKPVMAQRAEMKLSRIRFAGPTETSHAEIEIKKEEKSTDVSESGVELLIDDPKTAEWVQPLGSFILNCNAIRRLGLFWVQRLTSVPSNQFDSKSFDQIVETIVDVIMSRKGVPRPLQEQCRAAWQQALELDKVRTVLCGSATSPEGLICFDQRSDGKAPVIEDLSKLKELNDKALQLGPVNTT